MSSPSKGSAQKAKALEERRQKRRAKREARRSDNGLHTRPENAREERKRFLIVCEGAKTEPNYFKKFCADLEVYASVQGCGMNTLSLVEKAIQLRDKDKKRFDEV